MTTEQMIEYSKDVAEVADRKWREHSERVRFWGALSKIANPSTSPESKSYTDLAPPNIKNYTWPHCVLQAHYEVSQTAKWKDIVGSM